MLYNIFQSRAIIFSGETIITENSSGGMRAENSEDIIFNSNTLFDNNSNPNGDGGAIYASGTSIYMQGTVNFTHKYS